MLVERGFHVTTTKRTDAIANDMEMVTKKMMMSRLANNPNLTIMPETTVLAFEPEGVRVDIRGRETSLPVFDTVIIATGMTPERGLVELLQEAGVPFTVVGDADHSADIFTATLSDYRAAIELT